MSFLLLCVQFLPTGKAFVSGSEDKTARLFDMRSDQQVCVFRPPTANSSLTCVGVSHSGRVLMAGSDDSTVHLWDMLKGQHNGTYRHSAILAQPSVISHYILYRIIFSFDLSI